MEIAFLLKKLASFLVLPPLSPLLLVAFGLALARWRPRTGASLAWSGLVVALLSMTPVIVNPLARRLEGTAVLAGPDDLSDARAIVVLGGGQRRFMPEYSGPTPSRLTLERLRYGAHLARETELPVLVTGGAPEGFLSEAEIMAHALWIDYGVRVQWIENKSLDTADNARFSTQLLARDGIKRVVLVTHAAHMPRARREFERAGLEVVPAPTGFLSDDAVGERFWDYLPGMGGAFTSWYVAHEVLGLLAQKARFAQSD